MAEKSSLIFNYVEEKRCQGDTQIAKCKFCTAHIKAKLGVTINFVTHLKVRTLLDINN